MSGERVARVRERDRGWPGTPRRAAWALLALTLGGGAAARDGGYALGVHGDAVRGVLRVPEAQARRGSCLQCHTASGGLGLHDRRNRGNFGPEGDGLCLECHERRSPGASFQGEATYALSDHATSPAAVWPAPARRRRAEPGRCVTCHDPHGARDAQGLIPSLLRARPSALCLTCHDGDPAGDVASSFRRVRRHPLTVEVPGGPTQAGAGSASAAPEPQGATPAGGTCAACHDPHLARRDLANARPPAPSLPLAGVPRVRIANGPAGSPPLYTLLPADDPSPAHEYEVCLRCHSGFARRAPKQLDLGLLLNPANPSFHPIEDRGRGAGIDRRSFAEGWGPDQRVRCSDCHGDDAGNLLGVHGSSQEHLLRRRQPPAGAGLPVDERDLCFGCHAFATYGPAGNGAPSRYLGHASHASHRIGCTDCHDPHGSAALPSLLALRIAGLRAWVPTPTGGSCTVSCHRSAAPVASYQVGYAR